MMAVDGEGSHHRTAGEDEVAQDGVLNESLEDLGLDDWPADIDEEPKTLDEQSLSEIFWEELDLVWRAYIFVLKSWVELPGKLGGIAITEFTRLWEAWIGRPVKPRSWEIKFPQREDL